MSEQSDIPEPTPDDDVIPYQERVEFVIDQKLSALPSPPKASRLSDCGLAYVGPIVAETLARNSAQPIDFAGATTASGDAYWGSEGTAQPLVVTVGATTTQLMLPDDDCVYLVCCDVTLACDVADAGKLVGIKVGQWDFSGGAMVYAPVAADGECKLQTEVEISVFKGEANPYVEIKIDGRQLSVDPQRNAANVFVLQRPAL